MSEGKVSVLRIGHRPERDKRVTTHSVLVARAFGAEGVLLATEDKIIENTITDVVERFGGPFHFESGVSWRGVLNHWEGPIVHLTMYGIPLDEAMPSVPKDQHVLVVIGAEKVPREVYDKADFNIAVGNQPHSEIAALALFLDRYFDGAGLSKEFHGKLKVIPMEKGKKVEEIDG